MSYTFDDFIGGLTDTFPMTVGIVQDIPNLINPPTTNTSIPASRMTKNVVKATDEVPSVYDKNGLGNAQDSKPISQIDIPKADPVDDVPTTPQHLTHLS